MALRNRADPNSPIRAAIRTRMQESGIGSNQLARMALGNVSSSVSHFLCGHTGMRIDNLEKVMEVLNLELQPAPITREPNRSSHGVRSGNDHSGVYQ